jgi:hypothetical protein
MYSYLGCALHNSVHIGGHVKGAQGLCSVSSESRAVLPSAVIGHTCPPEIFPAWP